jgi:hypothetical protein
MPHIKQDTTDTQYRLALTLVRKDRLTTGNLSNLSNDTILRHFANFSKFCEL